MCTGYCFKYCINFPLGDFFNILHWVVSLITKGSLLEQNRHSGKPPLNGFNCLCLYYVYWHCLHSMRSSIFVMVWCPSVHPSVCLSHLPAVVACSGFAAVSLLGRRHLLIAARPAPQQDRAAARCAAVNVGSATFTAGIGS